MILGMGTDIVQISRIQTLLEAQGERFLNRVFTPQEQALAVQKSADISRQRFYARRYAAKEACAKALGTGIGRYLSFQDMEILSSPAGAPILTLTGEGGTTLAEKAKGQETIIHLSLSDDADYAIAVVILEQR